MALLKILCCLAVAPSAPSYVANDKCQDGCGMLQDVCRGEGDAATHLLQKQSHPLRGIELHQTLREKQTTTIKPFNCTKWLKPIQVKSSHDGTGFHIAELNTDDGSYTEIFAVPFSAVDGGFTVINSCGINPIDSILYCTIFAGGSWIIRLDDSAVEFVVRLPQYGWNSAGFSSAGRYYLSDPATGFIIVNDLHEMKGFADKYDQGLKAKKQWLKEKKKIYPKGWVNANDVVVVNANLDGCVGEYVMSLHGPYLQIAKNDDTADKWNGAWRLNVKPARWDNIYGAGWNFDNKVFFATNRGSGVHQVPMEKVNLTSGATVTLIDKGPCDAAVDNDGVNCPNAADPWGPTKLKAFDCATHNGKTLQLRKLQDAGVYQVADLDITTGEFTKIFNVPLNMTDPKIKSLNAVAISPKDSILYGVMERVSEWEDQGNGFWWPSPHYLVRFDNTTIEYVSILNVSSQPIAGTFDKSGNFYYVGGSRLYRIPTPDTMQGFSSTSAKGLPLQQFTNGSKLSEMEPMADLVVTGANFDGEGETEWILSVAHPETKVVVMKPGNPFNEGTSSWVIPAEYEIHPKQTLDFGAGWIFEDQVYFSSNDGAGIFKIPKEDITIPPPKDFVLKLEKIGESSFCPDNDGMQCMLDNPLCDA